MDIAEKRMKEAVDALIDDIDKNYLRGMQKQLFVCSSNCYDITSTREFIERCLEHCNKPVKYASNLLQKELEDLQEQLNRCAMTCLDKEKQTFGPDPEKYTVSESKEFNDRLSNCTSICVDDHIKLLPKIRKRMAESLKQYIK